MSALDNADEDDDTKKKKVEIDLPSKLQNKSIIKLIKATEHIYEQKNKNNKKLQGLIKRIDLDRPLVLREKLDIIWKESKQGSP
jgi:hypothetical protein